MADVFDSSVGNVAQMDQEQSGEFTVLDLVLILAKRKKLVLGLPLIAMVGAVIYSLLQPNIYTATTKILPPQQSQSTASAMLAQLGGLAGLAGAGAAKNPNDIYVAMLRSRTLADKLIARFKLEEVFDVRGLHDTRKILASRTAINLGKDGIVSVDFEDQDRKRAAEVANGYVDELRSLTQTLAVTEAGQRRLFFEKQLMLAKDNLASAEIALKQTQEKTGVVKLDDQGRAIIESVARMRAEIAAKEVQVFAMRSFATESNPEYVLLNQQLSGLKVQLSKLERVGSANAADAVISTGRLPEVGLEYIRKLRDLKYHEVIFDLMAKQYEIARIDEAKDSSIIQVLDKAIEPERKSKPHRAMIVLISTFLAGVIAVLSAFLAEFLVRARNDDRYVGKLRLLCMYIRGGS